MGDALNVLGCQRLGAARFQQAGQFLAAEAKRAFKQGRARTRG